MRKKGGKRRVVGLLVVMVGRVLIISYSGYGLVVVVVVMMVVMGLGILS